MAQDNGARSQADEGTVVVQAAGRPVDVDTSIAPIVAALNAAGVPTKASCSGHGHRPGNIALSDGREIVIARSFAEGRRIDALFPISGSGEEALSADLRSTRKRLGLTQVELAAKLDVAPEHICRIERGARSYTKTMRLALTALLLRSDAPRCAYDDGGDSGGGFAGRVAAWGRVELAGDKVMELTALCFSIFLIGLGSGGFIESLRK